MMRLKRYNVMSYISLTGRLIVSVQKNRKAPQAIFLNLKIIKQKKTSKFHVSEWFSIRKTTRNPKKNQACGRQDINISLSSRKIFFCQPAYNMMQDRIWNVCRLILKDYRSLLRDWYHGTTGIRINRIETKTIGTKTVSG